MRAKYKINIVFFVFAFGLIGFFALPADAADTYKLDPDHTSVIFRIKHLGVASVFGHFRSASGAFVFDENSPSNSSIEMQIEAKNIYSGVEKRDNHLKSPDFFNIQKFPFISFKSTSVKKIDTNNLEVSGDLTLLGQTRPITVRVVQTGQGKDPWGNFRRGFETTFTIKRSDFGMDFLLKVAADEVNLSVSAEGIRQ